ncbi:GIY-YIG nuclease family protein [Cellvibrio sp. PSBB023]|uniref:GIY-YIG nuclease family protein n=1 Tax=Cellvibrio sp. PSBB023 TaxID=1945512 RepID=UPI0009901B0A|nr:GIY-YIG nuclease family protein [Cellvibrio sp. PSBB023]AQT59967.1 methionine sulfoxide reductase [Cellvibrio sp. PSBB023]
MQFGRKVTVYLADASPSGIRHVEIANWSGQAVACPRSRLVELKDWHEAQRPGVYFLFEKQTAEVGDKVYVGESENVVKRLTQQDKDQEFWNEVIIFTSKDENLTKAHIKYLESRITSLAKIADRYKIENGNTPTESLLPRSDKDAMEEFIHNLKIVLGTLGHKVLEPIKIQSSQASTSTLSQYIFSFTVKGLLAKGQQTDDGFVLFKNSQVSDLFNPSMPGKLAQLKEDWVKDGTLTKTENHYLLTKDLLLSSSSYAAALVAGTARSGPQSWLNDNGDSLKIIEEILLKSAES